MQVLKYNYDSSYEYNISNHYLSRTYQIDENSWKTRSYDEYTTVYDGKFMEDITSYISEESVYVIKVNFRYKNTKGILSFDVLNDGEYLYTL